MPEKSYSSLGAGEWTLIISLWLLASIVIYIYPTSSLFWYFVASGNLVIVMFSVMILNIRNKINVNDILKNKFTYIIFYIYILGITSVFFAMGFAQVDNFLLFAVSSSFYTRGFIVVWAIFKMALGAIFIFLLIRSIKTLIAYLKIDKQRKQR
jgi:hypothetical protein